MSPLESVSAHTSAKGLLLQNVSLASGPNEAVSMVIQSGRIAHIANDGGRANTGIEAWATFANAKVVDLKGLTVHPGLVDLHSHFLGGGGYRGYSSRSPELQLSDFLASGVTTVVGVPGFDMLSRSMSGLVAKAYGLAEEGLNTYVFNGGFDLERGNITGSLVSDYYLLPVVAGVKVALGEPFARDLSFDD